MAIKKYSKVKFTLRKELIIILSAIVVLVVATILLNLPNKEEKFVSKWSEAGSQIVENRLYEEASFDNLDDILAANEVTFVLFATPSNADSVTQFDAIMNKAETYGLEKAYLIDSEFAAGDREEDADLDSKLKAIEDSFGIELDSVTNFWVFKGTELVGAADDYKVSDVIDWNFALSQLLTNTKENA
jgi:hypothetical protein